MLHKLSQSQKKSSNAMFHFIGSSFVMVRVPRPLRPTAALPVHRLISIIVHPGWKVKGEFAKCRIQVPLPFTGAAAPKGGCLIYCCNRRALTGKGKGLSPTEKLHSGLEAVAVPHLPQCAHWGTFPPGEGLGAPAPVRRKAASGVFWNGQDRSLWTG